MDNTARFLLAVLILLPFDYAIIRFIDYKLNNPQKAEKKSKVKSNIIDKDF